MKDIYLSQLLCYLQYQIMYTQKIMKKRVGLEMLGYVTQASNRMSNNISQLQKNTLQERTSPLQPNIVPCVSLT